MHKGRFGKRAHTNLAGEVELLLIAAAVLVDHVSGSPRNSTAIARTLGIPRPTVQRKLHKLLKRGIIERIDGRRYIMCEREPDDEYSYIDHALSLIRGAAENSFPQVRPLAPARS